MTKRLEDKYNNPNLTRTSAAWLRLDKLALTHLRSAGFSGSYISNIRAGRARPNPEQAGRAIDALRLSHPIAAEQLIRAYLLDITPASHLPHITELLSSHPLISPIHLPDKQQDKTHIIALSNLRRIALSDPIAFEAIILLSKHL